MADVLQLIASRGLARQGKERIMANQNQNPKQGQGTTQQGDNRQAGDVDGNRGAKPQTGSQGVNQTAGNQGDGTKSGSKTGGTGAGTQHDKGQ